MADDVAKLLEERPHRRRRIVAVTVILTVVVLLAAGRAIYQSVMRSLQASVMAGITSGPRASSSSWDSSAGAAPVMEMSAHRMARAMRIDVSVRNPDPLTVESFRITEAVVAGVKVSSLPPALTKIPYKGHKTLSFLVPGTFAGKTELSATVKAKFKHRDGKGDEENYMPIPVK